MGDVIPFRRKEAPPVETETVPSEGPIEAYAPLILLLEQGWPPADMLVVAPCDVEPA